MFNGGDMQIIRLRRVVVCGGSCFLLSHKPRCVKIFMKIRSASIKAITRISPWHLGRISGSAHH